MGKTDNIIFDFATEIEESLYNVTSLPDLIQVFIENYDLDRAELTEAQRFNLSRADKTLYSLLSLTQRVIRDLNERQESIISEYVKSSRDTNTTTETTK